VSSSSKRPSWQEQFDRSGVRKSFTASRAARGFFPRRVSARPPSFRPFLRKYAQLAHSGPAFAGRFPGTIFFSQEALPRARRSLERKTSAPPALVLASPHRAKQAATRPAQTFRQGFCAGTGPRRGELRSRLRKQAWRRHPESPSALRRSWPTLNSRLSSQMERNPCFLGCGTTGGLGQPKHTRQFAGPKAECQGRFSHPTGA